MYTHTIRNTCYSAIPCFCSPCQSLSTSLCSPLFTWKPSFGVMQPCPPWSQVARKPTSPFLIPSPSPPCSKFPTPFGFPQQPLLTKTTSRSRLPGSGTSIVEKPNSLQIYYHIRNRCKMGTCTTYYVIT